MILVIVSWLWIGVSTFCAGYMILFLLNRTSNYDIIEMDMVLLMGLCFLTVYAQFFSLIYKVGAVATLLLLWGILVILFFLWKNIICYIWEAILNIWKKKWMLVLFFGLGALLAIVTSGEATHYDTYLYHAQDIRWIEEYGIVPGLGNLHNRLAYNSSLFCLQALFSMKFLVNQSLHSLNGFIMLILLSYAICSLKAPRQQKFFISDFLRLGLIIFLNSRQNYQQVSSPGSDQLAIGLVFYVFIKWISLWEDHEDREEPYIYLCFLAVFDISVKLSAAMVVMLAMIPAITLLKRKKWRKMFGYILVGIVIILPFLMRNVIISGYLLYPYPEMDFFDVDWKMPVYTVIFDRSEIKTWGWGLNDVKLFNTPFREWFAFWFANLGRLLKVLFVLNILATIVALIYGFYKGLKKDWKMFWIVLTVTANFMLWFIGAPLPRYGSAYMMLMPLLVIGWIFSKVWERKKCVLKIAAGSMIAFVSYCMHPVLDYGIHSQWEYKGRSADYAEYMSIEYKLGEETIYVPKNGDQIGYCAFPSTPYAARLELIELRGSDISAGFRMKEEYRRAFVSTYGYIEEKDMFSED